MVKLENKIAYELGEEVVKNLGHGDFGEVFLLKSGKVLKLTSDENEVLISKKLVKYKKLFKNIVNYYNVGEIETTIKTDYKYYILMDYVEPLSKLEKFTINYFYTPLLQYSKSFYEYVFGSNFIDFIIYRYSLLKIKDQTHTEKEKMQIRQMAIDFIPHVKDIAKDLKLHNIKQCDFHAGNLGWNIDHTKLFIFDITTPTKYGLDKLLMPELKLKKMTIHENIVRFKDFPF